MSNTIYEDKLYNERLKRKYLDEFKEGTQKIYLRMFKVSQIMESELEKDLFEFSREELRKLFYMYMPKTEASSNSNCQYISKYIDWCIDEGMKKTLNPLDMVDSVWKKQFANSTAKRFWTKTEIDNIVDTRENAQDAVIIQLLIEGVRGSGNSEILNLNKRSLDPVGNQLHLEDDDGTRRTITVSDKCLKLCLQALQEKEYSKMNGNTSPDIKAPTANLADSEFVVRNAVTRTIYFNEADKSVVHRRLSKIAIEMNLSNFTPLALSRSGMLILAKQRLEEHGRLTDESIMEIANLFGEQSNSVGYRLKNDFLNEKTIIELYGLS